MEVDVTPLMSVVIGMDTGCLRGAVGSVRDSHHKDPGFKSQAVKSPESKPTSPCSLT